MKDEQIILVREIPHEEVSDPPHAVVKYIDISKISPSERIGFKLIDRGSVIEQISFFERNFCSRMPFEKEVKVLLFFGNDEEYELVKKLIETAITMRK